MLSIFIQSNFDKFTFFYILYEEEDLDDSMEELTRELVLLPCSDILPAGPIYPFPKWLPILNFTYEEEKDYSD